MQHLRALLRAHDARVGAVHPEQRLYPGRQAVRAVGMEAMAEAHPAQQRLPHHRLRHAECGQHHHDGVWAELPGDRDLRAHGFLGGHHQRGAALSDHSSAVRPGALRLPGCADYLPEPVRRRHPGRIRPLAARRDGLKGGAVNENENIGESGAYRHHLPSGPEAPVCCGGRRLPGAAPG